MVSGFSTSPVLMMCYAGSELGTFRLPRARTISFWTLSINFSLLNLVLRPGVFPSVLCRGCLRLPTNCPSTSGLRWTTFSVRCWILAELTGLSTAPPPCTLLKTVVCLLVVHVCRTVDRVVGHPRPSLSGMGVPWVSLLGPTEVGWHQGKAPTLFVVAGLWSCRCLLCTLPNMFNVISLHCSCACFVSNNNS